MNAFEGRDCEADIDTVLKQHGLVGPAASARKARCYVRRFFEINSFGL
jgi:hypothetical protein